MTRADLRVLLIHGLEGSPQGTKARFLDEHFTTLTPAMDTRDFEACVALQAQAVAEFAPDVVVGSSFGGAVALRLLRDGVWSGPTVLLAQAGKHFGVPLELPEGAVVTVVHGIDDDVVDVADSRALAATGRPPGVQLLEVHDAHRLQTIVDDGSLASIVTATAARSTRGGAARAT
jgi:hypothetical protein